jgi:SAM-dependent methyltransferase/alpha-ketoglutarate-dependent taurine dioxygenase
MKNDDENLVLVESIDGVDKLNADFYGRFPYPWRAVILEYFQDPQFETVMLNQNAGDWGHGLLPPNPKIWIAGCGTNQAVLTALRFPAASVVGSDVSDSSLRTCGAAARALGVKNLELRQESINQVTYREEFDLIMSTGVIHHNADPQATLGKISAALKPGGVLELMVYNRFHWTVPAAFQKAIRILGGDAARDAAATGVDFDAELALAKSIIGELPQETMIGLVAGYRENSDEMLADELLQPVLHSYTVETLAEMAAACGLEILLPCLNAFDKTEEKYTWNMRFTSPELRAAYDALPDLRRWQVTNLLLREKSPQLWFYLQRTDSGRRRKSEREVCEEFLDTRFVRNEIVQRAYVQSADSTFKLLPNPLRWPAAPPDPTCERIMREADGSATMREIFRRLEIEPTFENVDRARVMLTTSAFPYLKAMPQAVVSGSNGSASAAVTSDEAERRERAERKLKKFKSIKPVAVSLPRAEIVKTSPLREGEMLPLVVAPAAEGVHLADWAVGNREWVADRLAEHGAILFRGFGVAAAPEFERFAGVLSRQLLDNNGEHQRTNISDHVYTPVFYPAEQQLLWHNENSFNHEWPSRIWFCCLKPAAAGGETPVVDSRRVFERLNPDVRERFVRRGVMYVRNYGTGVGLDWQTVFRTQSREEVEERCRLAGMRYEWKDGDRLRTSCVRPAAVRHPRTGEPVWFNQAQHWHVSCLDPETRESMRYLFAEEDMPRQCYYGDGGVIEDEEMAEVLRVYAGLEVSFPWEAGDVLMVDNLLAAHGRNRFEGERKLLVTMGDVLSYDDVETV